MLAKSCTGTGIFHLDSLLCLCQGQPHSGEAFVVQKYCPDLLGLLSSIAPGPGALETNYLYPQTSPPNGPWKLKSKIEPKFCQCWAITVPGARQRGLLERFSQPTLRTSSRQGCFERRAGGNWGICILNSAPINSSALDKTVYDVKHDGEKQRTGSPLMACQVLDRKQLLLRETLGVQGDTLIIHFLVGLLPSLNIILLSLPTHTHTHTHTGWSRYAGHQVRHTVGHPLRALQQQNHSLSASRAYNRLPQRDRWSQRNLSETQSIDLLLQIS